MIDAAFQILMSDRAAYGKATAVPGGIVFYQGAVLAVRWEISKGPLDNQTTVKRYFLRDKLTSLWPSDTFYFMPNEARNFLFELAVVATTDDPRPGRRGEK